MTGNALYGLGESAWTLYAYSLSNLLTSDYNYLFHPYVDKHIAYGTSWTRLTFAGWQAFSSQDSHSKTNWFTQPVGEASLARIFYNPSRNPATFDLGSRKYLDLDQNPVVGSLTLQPFTSRSWWMTDPHRSRCSVFPRRLCDVDEAADFTLTVTGYSFTHSSVVRWNGSDRPTTYISDSRLTAAIDAAGCECCGRIPGHGLRSRSGALRHRDLTRHVPRSGRGFRYLLAGAQQTMTACVRVQQNTGFTAGSAEHAELAMKKD